jgi:predicted nucleic acid-binding protein
LRDAAANGNGVLSTQVLQELYVTVIKKLNAIR